jgi:tetratricopeptide (TPR) repeat protein
VAQPGEEEEEEPEPPAPAPAPVPPPPVAPEKPENELVLDRARQELAAGNLEEACELFQKSDALSPSEEAKFEFAQCLELRGDRREAAEAYDKVVTARGARAAEARRRAKRIRDALARDEKQRQEREKELKDEGKRPRFSDFVDTRLSWTFGDDDVLHATGETTPLSPNASIGDRRPYRLFFDNLNSRFGGRENLTHLVLYSKMPGFIDRLDTEASLVLRFNLTELARKTNNIDKSLEDAGTFIRVFVRTGANADEKGKDEKEGVGLTFWPIDTDRFRLGYLYDISWGGTNANINQSIFPRIQGSAPGAKVQYDQKYFSVYGGFKTAQIVQVEEIVTPGVAEVEVIRVGETNFGALGGASGRPIEYITVDVGGGFFQQGKFDLPDVLGEQVYTTGVSARLAGHSAGSGPGQSVDFALYRNDPMKHDTILKREKYDPDKTTWSAIAEFSNLWQRLKNFDVPGELVLQQARAAALQGNLKTGFFRLSLTGIYRDLPFVLRNVPSFVPFESIPDEAETEDEFFVAAAVDYHFDGPKLTPGIGVGLQFPSTFQTDQIDAGGNTIGRTVVVREQGNVSILPAGRTRVPIFQARASLKWDLSDILSAIVWIQYIRDNNGTFVERDPNEGTVALRTFVNPDFLGLGTSVQATF